VRKENLKFRRGSWVQSHKASCEIGQPSETKQWNWLRGVDLNHRPLGYEFPTTWHFNELAGVVAYIKECNIAGQSVEEFLFWVGFGLGAEIKYLELSESPRRDLNPCYRRERFLY
jgi:hypothetical protein